MWRNRPPSSLSATPKDDMTRSLILVLLSLLSTKIVIALSAHPLLLLISFDGFRFDLLNETLVPTIYQWSREHVVFTKGVRSQFVTLTAPNHMSIVTGLVPERHGIVSNLFYDPHSDQQFDIFNTKEKGAVERSLQSHWYFGEPIWQTNQKAAADRRSASLRWPMGEANLSSSPNRPFYDLLWKEYRNLSKWITDVDQIVGFFKNETHPVNFVQWYIEEPDHTLHEQGFNTGALEKVLRDLDELFALLLTRLENAGLLNDVNIILTADHGHAEVDGYHKLFCVRDYVDVTIPDVHFGEFMLYPSNEKVGKAIFDNLTRGVINDGFAEGIEIIWKKNFPTEYGWKGTDRVGEIIIDAHPGWFATFDERCSKKKLEETFGEGGREKFHMSMHGMRPEDWRMRAMLAMSGPAFAQQIEVESIPSNVDVYGLMAQVLGVETAPNNGSLSILALALQQHQRDSFFRSTLAMVLVIAILALLLISAAVLFLRQRGIRSLSEVTIDNVKKAIFASNSNIKNNDVQVENGSRQDRT